MVFQQLIRITQQIASFQQTNHPSTDILTAEDRAAVDGILTSQSETRDYEQYPLEWVDGRERRKAFENFVTHWRRQRLIELTDTAIETLTERTRNFQISSQSIKQSTTPSPSAIILSGAWLAAVSTMSLSSSQDRFCGWGFTAFLFYAKEASRDKRIPYRSVQPCSSFRFEFCRSEKSNSN